MNILKESSLEERTGQFDVKSGLTGRYDHQLWPENIVTGETRKVDTSIGLDQLKCSLSPNAVQNFRWKRALDALLILPTLPFLIPLALFIALLIRSVSIGPVLFRQERVGYRGRRFRCFKFRTMFVNADTTTHQEHFHHLMNSNTPMMKMDARGDSRIIPLGSLLRASGLDELPQLINVLRGEMSLVGPRPCLPYEYDNYVPWQKERFETLPGLTGLWQVSGKNRTTFVEMIQFDIDYARSRSLWLDLLIILKTIPALLVQMVETRKRGKMLADSGQSESATPVQASNSYSIPGTVFSATVSR